MKIKNFSVKKTTKLFLKTLCVIFLGGILMGNDGCQEQSASKKRTLKRSLELGKISAMPLVDKNGQKFDFETLVNNMIWSVTGESDEFAIIPRVEVGANGISLGGDAKWNSALQKYLAAAEYRAGKLGVAQLVPSREVCNIYLPNRRLKAFVSGFDLTGENGVEFGYTAGPGGVKYLTGFGIGAHFTSYSLNMEVDALDPIAYEYNKGKDQSLNNLPFHYEEKSTDREFDFTIGIGFFNLGFEHKDIQPIVRIVRNALKGALEQLSNRLDQKGSKWFTRGFENADHNDRELVILGGSNLNIHEGDIFKLYNESFQWEDGDRGLLGCGRGAAYVGSIKKDIYVGKAKAITVDENLSVLQIIPGEEQGTNPVYGVRVELDTLAEDVPPPPKSKP